MNFHNCENLKSHIYLKKVSTEIQQQIKRATLKYFLLGVFVFLSHAFECSKHILKIPVVNIQDRIIFLVLMKKEVKNKHFSGCIFRLTALG